MKRYALWAAFAAFGLAACTDANQATFVDSQWAACRVPGFAPTRITACSVVIAEASTTAERRSEALTYRAALHGDAGQYSRAVADLGRALRLNPNNAQALFERASLHHERAAFPEAVADYEAALALDPALEEARSRREMALAGNTQAPEDLVAEIDTLIELNPRNPDLWNQRCWTRATAGIDLDLALYDCNEALRLNPRHNEALDSRGLVHFKRGEYADAARDYDAALRLEPGRGHYLYGRGLSRIGMGMVAEGEADLAAAERAEPSVARLYASYRAVRPDAAVQTPTSLDAE